MLFFARWRTRLHKQRHVHWSILVHDSLCNMSCSISTTIRRSSKKTTSFHSPKKNRLCRHFATFFVRAFFFGVIWFRLLLASLSPSSAMSQPPPPPPLVCCLLNRLRLSNLIFFSSCSRLQREIRVRPCELFPRLASGFIFSFSHHPLNFAAAVCSSFQSCQRKLGKTRI